MNILQRVLFALCAAACATSVSTSAAPRLREQIWTQPSPDLAHVLTHAPAECFVRPNDPGQQESAEIGRALFRSPALIGGPAARTGLSCNACHSNGRANASFFLPELTDRPGAADVTSEWASKVRGDGMMNPRDIPDLAGVGAKPTHGQHADPSLEHFTRSVMEEEFQGPPPPDQAFAGVIAYLRALDADACPAGETPIRLDDATDDVRRALAAAEGADEPTARLVLLATQDAVARVVERLPQQRFAEDRTRLENLSRELGAWRAAPTSPALATLAPSWIARFDGVIAHIRPRAARTYFSQAEIARDLASH